MRDASRAPSPPEAAANPSKGPAGLPGLLRGIGLLRMAVLALGLASGLLLVAADLTTIRSVTVLTATCESLASPEQQDLCRQTGGEQHSYALLLLGPFAILLAAAAALAGSRPAAAALVAVGAVVFAITLVGDVPDMGKTGVVGDRFDSAEASAGPALWLEAAGAALAVLGGTLFLSRGGRRRGGRRKSRPGRDARG